MCRLIENTGMDMPVETLKEFKEIFEDEFDEEFSDEEVRDMAERLIGFLLLMERPVSEGPEPEDVNPDIGF